jgi:hypothetical protein
MSDTRPRSVFFGISTLLVVVALVLTSGGMLTRASNCGGNSAALAVCGAYTSIVYDWQMSHKDAEFRYSQLDRSTLQEVGDPTWLHFTRFLAKVDNLRIDFNGEKEIVVVCIQAFDNVPERLLWKAPMAYAVGYSNGTTGLISPEQFGRLDLSGFSDLRELWEHIDDDRP